MEQTAKSNKKISHDAKQGKDVAKVGFFIIFLIIFLYFLTITVLPVYAR